MTSPSASIVQTERAPSARSRLARALCQIGQDERIALVHLPAPVVDPIAVFAAGRSETASLFVDPLGRSFAGIGEAAVIRADGPHRFEALRDHARDLFARTVAHGAGPLPTIAGAFSFSPGSASTAPWDAFGDARFALPRWSYRVANGRATLSFAAGPDDRDPDRALAELASIAARWADPAIRTASLPSIREVAHESRASWAERIAAIGELVEIGQADKIVAARRVALTFDGRPAPEAVLARLADRFAGCTLFALRRGDATFLGATPEQLVALDGLAVRTEALAGSIGAAEPDAEARLFARVKDRAEHALVVDEIDRRLVALGARVTRPEEPSVRRLPNVLHLETPIRARLSRGAHLFDVAAALHPTPAVGGVPREAALRFIEEVEPSPRGLYAGPVGFVDARGDGQLWVALRSGLFAGDRAWLHAGGGIVRGSEEAAEWEETRLKLDALLGVLGEVESAR